MNSHADTIRFEVVHDDGEALLVVTAESYDALLAENQQLREALREARAATNNITVAGIIDTALAAVGEE